MPFLFLLNPGSFSHGPDQVDRWRETKATPTSWMRFAVVKHLFTYVSGHPCPCIRTPKRSKWFLFYLYFTSHFFKENKAWFWNPQIYATRPINVLVIIFSPGKRKGRTMGLFLFHPCGGAPRKTVIIGRWRNPYALMWEKVGKRKIQIRKINQQCWTDVWQMWTVTFRIFGKKTKYKSGLRKKRTEAGK